MDLINKTVVVTGGSDGLGLALVKRLIKKQAQVITCSRDYKKLEKVCRKIASPKLKYYQCDVADSVSVRNFAQRINKIDILINNAGIWIEGQITDHTYKKISQVIDINLKGTIFITRAFLSKLDPKQSTILNIISTSALGGRANTSVYSASKYGVAGFTDSLKKSLKDTNTKVIAFYPGGMNTYFHKKGGTKYEQISKWMDVGKVADIIIYLLEIDSTLVLDYAVLNKIVR